MKNILIPIILFLFIGCSNEENEPAPIIEQLSLKLSQVEFKDGSAFLTYDDFGRLKKISNQDNSDNLDIFHVSNGIQIATNNTDPVDPTNPIYYENTSFHPYNIVSTNGNPTLIEAVSIDSEKWVESSIHISYDSKINPIYLVLDQSGMIPTIDDLILSSPDPIYSNLKARGILAINNPTKIEYFDEKGVLIGTATIEYQYNSQDLPEVAIVNSDGVNEVIKFNYTSK